jgi:hypothetical protein
MTVDINNFGARRAPLQQTDSLPQIAGCGMSQRYNALGKNRMDDERCRRRLLLVDFLVELGKRLVDFHNLDLEAQQYQHQQNYEKRLVKHGHGTLPCCCLQASYSQE